MTPFKERMNLYRAYRELNPDKNYWDWKQSLEVPAMRGGGETPPNPKPISLAIAEAKEVEERVLRGLLGNESYPFEHELDFSDENVISPFADAAAIVNRNARSFSDDMLKLVILLREEKEELLEQDIYNYKLMANSLATAAELGSGVWMLGKGAKALNLLPQRFSGLYNSDAAQIAANTIGTVADTYQLLTAETPVEVLENSIELPADVAGIVGGTNIVRNTPWFGRYGNAVDNVLDVFGYGAAAYDVLLKPTYQIHKYFTDNEEVPAMENGGNTEDYVGQKIDLYALQLAISQTGRDLYIADHTDPNTGVVSPFYDKNIDAYGTYQLPELTIKPEYKSAQLMERALNAAAANRGRQYYHDAMREIDAGRRVAELAEWTPVGDIIDLTNAGIAAALGDYLTAGMMAGMMFVPGFIQNPGKLLYRGLRNNGLSRNVAKYYTKNPSVLIYGIENNTIPAFAGKSKDEIRTVLEQYGVSPGLAADLVKFPYTTLNTIQKAPDLSTFAKKRKFLLDVHDTMDDYLAVAQRLNDEDFALRRSLFFPQHSLVANRAKWNVELADLPINTDVALNSASFKNNLYKGVPDEKIPYGSSGVARRVNQHVSLLDPVTGIPRTPSEIAETAVHEVLHARTRQQPEFEKMRAYSNEEDAFVFAGDVPGIPKQATDIFNPLARWTGINNYRGGISEWFSRKAEYEAGRGKKHFREMSDDEQNEMVDYMYMYFGKDFGDERITKDDIRKMLTDSSAIGFKYGGMIL